MLAYQLLGGAPPFAHAKDLELIRMHLQAPAPRPSARWPEVPPALEELLLAMLAKDPAARPTMDAIQRGIEDARRALCPEPARPAPKKPFSLRALFSSVGATIAAVFAVIA